MCPLHSHTSAKAHFDSRLLVVGALRRRRSFGWQAIDIFAAAANIL